MYGSTAQESDSQYFCRKHKSVRACVFFKNQVFPSHMILIYGEHASPVMSVTHTRCGKDPADIPKESKDPTTLWVGERKTTRDTSHELQESTRSRDDITESTVLTMVIKVIIPAPDKVISWNLVTFLYDWPQQWAPYNYKPRVHVIYVRT